MGGGLWKYKFKIFPPRHFGIICATGKTVIAPKKGQTKAPRIRALGKDFHLACFKCEVNIIIRGIIIIIHSLSLPRTVVWYWTLGSGGRSAGLSGVILSAIGDTKYIIRLAKPKLLLWLTSAH